MIGRPHISAHGKKRMEAQNPPFFMNERISSIRPCSSSSDNGRSSRSLSHGNLIRSLGLKMPSFFMFSPPAKAHIRLNVDHRTALQSSLCLREYPFMIAFTSHIRSSLSTSWRGSPISPTSVSYNSWAVMRFFRHLHPPCLLPVRDLLLPRLVS